MSVIFFGDVHEALVLKARDLSTDAILIDNCNYKTFIANKRLPPVSYTSLGDLPKNLSVVYSILDLASEIVYCPPKEWSDKKIIDSISPCNSMHGLSEFIILEFQKTKHNVKNFTLSFCPNSSILDLADKRKSNSMQIWIVGCSISHGVGVNQDQRYGQLVSNSLGLPVSFLTASGSSPEWAADQILRSDIRSDDLVIWGLTADQRMPWFDSSNNRVMQITNSALNKFPQLKKTFIDVLISETRIYKTITSVYQIINYCKNIQSKLLIMGLLASDTVTMNLAHLVEFEPFIYLKQKPRYLDLGTDSKHPGPRQHQSYSKFCLQQLTKKNFI